MRYLIDINVSDEFALDRAMHDATVAIRCDMLNLSQRREFHYLNSDYVRIETLSDGSKVRIE